MWAKTLRRNARFLLTGLKTRPYILFTMAGLLVANADAGRVRAPKGYVLVWSDEFKGKNGALPDAKKWTYDIGGSGWGNHELEYYTSRVENARIEHGKLVITARREYFIGPDGKKFDYTSTRLKTQGLFAQAYGRFEARIKIPAGQGIWPAFWMLGENIVGDG
jgi:beta-glucanase (GH16 family)